VLVGLKICDCLFTPPLGNFHKISENPSFQYTLQLDCEEQITNISWTDAKMIIDYAHLGDVVNFDTTFGTKKNIGLLVYLLDSIILEILLFLMLLFCLMKHVPLSHGYLRLL
jgi:hypothetical protein